MKIEGYSNPQYIPPKPSPNPNESAYEHANDNARFMRTNLNSIPESVRIELSIYEDDLEAVQTKFKAIVEDLVKRQGKTIKNKDIFVDDTAKAELNEMLENESSPESVSDRIVGFAKAISGNDTSKFDLLKSSIEEGFEAAKGILGKLPEISTQTFDMIIEKLEAWRDGTDLEVEEVVES